jgi:hypothetical protein
MKKVLFILTSIAIFALAGPAFAQYVPWPHGPWPPGIWVGPGYMAPGIYRAYRWREQRFYEDPRRNSYIVPETLNFEQQIIQNNAIRRGIVTDPGECAIGFSEETCRRRGQKYNPPRQD